jgi:glycosyltransferase involved in cell wall biosynthesis
MMPAISVIIPLYNKAAHVRRAVASVLAQDCDDFEVIVVNDGSTDHGEEVVWQISDPRVRLIYQENRGPGAARNAGIRAARSNILAFLDADDEWLPHYLYTGLAALAHYPDAVAVTQGHLAGDPAVSTQPQWVAKGLGEGLQRLDRQTAPRFAISLLAYMSPWSTMARKETIAAYHGFYDRYRCLYGEDHLEPSRRHVAATAGHLPL